MFVGFPGPGLPSFIRDAPIKFKIRGDATVKDMHEQAARELSLAVEDLTLRPIIMRENKTRRPDEPLDPYSTQKVEDLVSHSTKKGRSVCFVALPRSIALPFVPHSDFTEFEKEELEPDHDILIFFKRYVVPSA